MYHTAPFRISVGHSRPRSPGRRQLRVLALPPPVERERKDASRERAIGALSPSDTAALRPHLKATRLQQKTVLYETGGLIKAVYFPINAVAFLVVSLSTGEMTEAAMVGKDGAIGMRQRWMEKSH